MYRRPRVQLLLCLVVLIAIALALSGPLTETRFEPPKRSAHQPPVTTPSTPPPSPKIESIRQAQEETIRRAQAAGDLPRAADAYFQLGKLEYRAGDWKGSLDSHRQALHLYRQLGNSAQGLVVLNEMSLALEQLGMLEEARLTYLAALELARRLNDRESESKVRLNLGLMDLEMGETGKALANFEVIRALAVRERDSPLEALALNACGRAHTRMGEIRDALKLHGQALTRFKRLGIDQQIAVTLLHIADAYREIGQYALAAEYYRRALDRGNGSALLPGDRAKALNNLGIAYYRAGNDRDALKVYRRALTLFHERKARAEEAVVLANLGWVYDSRGNPGRALKAYEQALPVALELKHRPTLAAIYLGMAHAERSRNNLTAARQRAEQALGLVEALRTTTESRELRVSFLAGRQNFYGFLIDLLMEQHRLQPNAGHDVAAFEVSERSRARGLQDSLGGEALPLRRIQTEVLDRDSVLLEYFFGETKSYLWVVTASSFESFQLPGWREIQPLARDVHRLLPQSHHQEEKQEAAEKSWQLSRLLLGSVAGRLRGKRLIIVGPPVLQSISFAALPDPTLDSVDRRDLWSSPLLLHHQIVSEPSASNLAALQRRGSGRSQAPQALLLVAYPVHLQGSRFSPLPGTLDEAKDIARIAHGQGLEVRSLLEDEARKDHVLKLPLSSFGILHFALHGDPNAEDPDQPALVLSEIDAQGRPIDSYLRPREIETMPLQAELVVLSACGTGLGREISGEGLAGLTQAFFRAGAQRIVVSLWDVDDEVTALLMGYFYENLLNRRLPPAAALREAQLKVWRNDRLRPPSNWAGFVFQGDWE